MAVDIKDAGALAGIRRYGVPWHGRIESGTLYTGKLDTLGSEITRAWPQPVGGDCWLIQRPGLPDPYADDAAGKAEAALEGKELTNWALLAGAGNVHGKAFTRTADYKHRWLWVDANGETFSVTFGLVAGTPKLDTVYGTDADGFTPRDFMFADAMTARFLIRRYGDLRVEGEPAPTVTVDHVIDGGALGQATPALLNVRAFDAGVFNIDAGNMILRDLTPTGNKAIMEVHSLIFDSVMNRRTFGSVVGTRPFVTHRECSRSLGYVEFTLSGTGAAPSVSMSVLATREAVLGTRSHEYTATSFSTSGCPEDDADPWSFSWSFTQVYSFEGRVVGYGYNSSGTPEAYTLAASTETTSSLESSFNGVTVARTSFGSSESIATLSVGSYQTTATLGNTTEQDVTGSTLEDCTFSRTDTIVGTWPVPSWNSSATTTGPTSCWTGCVDTAPTYTPYPEDALAEDAYVLPSGRGVSRSIIGVICFGSGFYTAIGGAIGQVYVSLGTVSRHGVDTTTAQWNPSIFVATRLYGARNPATGEIAYPKTTPVNFA